VRRGSLSWFPRRSGPGAPPSAGQYQTMIGRGENELFEFRLELLGRLLAAIGRGRHLTALRVHQSRADLVSSEPCTFNPIMSEIDRFRRTRRSTVPPGSCRHHRP
jgi:hypothetical protein